MSEPSLCLPGRTCYALRQDLPYPCYSQRFDLLDADPIINEALVALNIDY